LLLTQSLLELGVDCSLENLNGNTAYEELDLMRAEVEESILYEFIKRKDKEEFKARLLKIY